MRRAAVAAFAVLAFVSVAHDARAQEAPQAEEPPTPAPRKVRVRVRLEREREFADVFTERRGTWGFECRAPCTIDAIAGERGRIDFPGTTDEPVPFTVPSDGAEVHDIEVRRRGKAKLVGGLVAFGAGALSLALGMAIIRGAGKDDLFGEANRAVARILLLLGAASGVTGTVLVVTRSTEPVLVPTSPTPTPTPTRLQALEDVTPLRSSAASVVPLPSLPFVWTGRF